MELPFQIVVSVCHGKKTLIVQTILFMGRYHWSQLDGIPFEGVNIVAVDTSQYTNVGTFETVNISYFGREYCMEHTTILVLDACYHSHQNTEVLYVLRGLKCKRLCVFLLAGNHGIFNSLRPSDAYMHQQINHWFI